METTTYGKASKVFGVVTLVDGTVQLGGYWDGATDAVDEELHAMLEPYIHQFDDAVGDHLQHAHDHDHGDEFDKLGSKLREEAENWFDRSVDEVKKATEPAKTGKTNDEDPLDRLFRR